MAGRDHNTTVKAIGTGNISHRRRCCHVEKISIRSGRHQSANQRILKHIAGTSGILADHDPGCSRLSGPPAQFIIIPSQKTPDLKCMIRRQRNTRFPTEAICTKIFSHFSSPLCVNIYNLSHIWLCHTGLIRIVLIFD